MPSTHLQASADWILDRNVELVADTYTTKDDAWRPFCRVISPADMMFPNIGHRWVGQVGEAEGRPWQPGQEPEGSTVGKGYVRQLAAGRFRRMRSIPLDLVEASRERALDQAQTFVREYTAAAQNRRNRIFADVLQKGTLSAGSAATFNQTFPDYEDANIGKIYDGKPLFAATGNAHPYKFHTASGDEGVNLTVSLALTTANLPTAFVGMENTNALDEAGNQIYIKPTHAIVGSAMQATATQVFASELVAEGNNNAVNAYRNMVQVSTNPFIRDSASASAWWLIQGDMAFKAVDSGPVRVFNRIDERTGVLEVWCEDFFSIACEDWRYVACFNKAAS